MESLVPNLGKRDNDEKPLSNRFRIAFVLRCIRP
jgi:hypothetical protein